MRTKFISAPLSPPKNFDAGAVTAYKVSVGKLFNVLKFLKALFLHFEVADSIYLNPKLTFLLQIKPVLTQRKLDWMLFSH